VTQQASPVSIPQAAEAGCAADYDLQGRLHDLVQGACSPAAFAAELAQVCASAPGRAWEVLSLIDQHYRRGKLSADHRQLIRHRIERQVLGLQAADEVPRLAVLAQAGKPVAEAAPACGADEVRALRTELYRARGEARRFRARIARLAAYARRNRAALAASQRQLRVARAVARPLWRNRLVQVPAILALVLALGASPALKPTWRPEPVPPGAIATPMAVAAATVVPAPEPAQISLTADRYIVAPGGTSARVSVRRSGATNAAASFVWWADGSGAKSGRDFVAQARRPAAMAAGASHMDLLVPIIANPARRHTELFYVSIGQPGTGAQLGSIRKAAVIIMRTN
jgi:hypothetical protein